MRAIMLTALALTALALMLSGCTTAYWDRPGAQLPDLARESEACYQVALDPATPAAFPARGATERLLPRTEPPPALWNRAPREAALEHFDEQLRYERCMRSLGWQVARYGGPETAPRLPRTFVAPRPSRGGPR
jgi:hypothetical protein